MTNNIIRCVGVQVKDRYSKKYKRASNIRDHQRREKLKKKWNNIINRYIKKYTTEKYIVGFATANIVDRTAITTLRGDYYSPVVITCDKGPEN